MTYDHPRNTSDIPTASPMNQTPDHGHSAQRRIPSTNVTAPSKAAHPQLGNFRRIALMSRKRPMTMKHDANNKVQASAPATG